jgi:sugar/nucleoside kinase (ribokinase family)
MKEGAKDCTIFRRNDVMELPGYRVAEVDPTGAGDSFSAGVTVGLLEAFALCRVGQSANSVGALAVTQRGPMQGAPTREQVRAVMAQRS